MKSANQFIVLVCLFVFCIETINAQVEVARTEMIVDKMRLNRSIDGKDMSYGDIQGDPYIFKDFQKGILYVNSDEKAEVDIRYDIFADQMHLKDKDQIYAIIHPEKVKLIEAGSYKFIYSAYLKSPGDKEPEESSYFILRAEGKCMLLLKKNIRIQDPEPPKLYQEAKPAKFVFTSDSYFIKLESKTAVRIKNKKDLLTVLVDQSDAIDKYITANRLDIRDLNDLEKIVVYYNGL